MDAELSDRLHFIKARFLPTSIFNLRSYGVLFPNPFTVTLLLRTDRCASYVGLFCISTIIE